MKATYLLLLIVEDLQDIDFIWTIIGGVMLFVIFIFVVQGILDKAEEKGKEIKNKTTSYVKKNKLDKKAIRSANNTTDFLGASLNKAKKIAEQKISKSYLTGCNWVLVSDILKKQYIFKNNDELLIATNGVIRRHNYELIIDSNTVLITIDGVTEMHNIVVVKNDFLFIERIKTNEILKFINQTKVKDYLKSELDNLLLELEEEYI